MKLERRNVFVCRTCHKFTVTVDVDQGLAPTNIKCTKDGCKGFAYTCGYPKEVDERLGDPTHEWYTPRGGEYLALDVKLRDYVDKGGLLLRERTNQTPVYHSSLSS